MSKVIAGRVTAQIEAPYVVFIIGIRVNKVLAIKKWLPTFKAMRPMLQTLIEHPEKGFLGGERYGYWRGAMVIQYWRSFEDLEKFARSPSELHLKSWQWFNKAVGSDGTVGIWHETYEVSAGETIYENMPLFGLAKATKSVPAKGGMVTARRRIGKGENEPAVETPTDAGVI